ncbi:MAG: YeeE/YedE family protein [bacterium]|nr:YeeE/YedE family protein [bacterium]
MKEDSKPAAGTSAFGYLAVLLVGAYLGILFTKSEVASWERVHKMFLFQEAHMYLIIGVAIAVAMVSMLVIKRFEVKSVSGKPIKYKPKPYHTGVIIGGVMFGAGWAITGACPGPIYAQIGSGEWLALVTLAGAMIGMFSYAYLKPKLPH